MSSSRSARAGTATARRFEIVLCSGLGLVPMQEAWAQATPAVISIESGLQATDNGALASGADRRSDLIDDEVAWRAHLWQRLDLFPALAAHTVAGAGASVVVAIINAA